MTEKDLRALKEGEVSIPEGDIASPLEDEPPVPASPEEPQIADFDCPKCKRVLRAGAKFCDNCGNSVAGDLAPTLPMDIAKFADTLVDTDSLIGCVFESKYEIIELLGKGSMGRVYRARRSFGGDVAIKFLHKIYVADQMAIQRFRREVQAAATIRHANVVVIHDYGESANQDVPAYIVMELVRGKSLTNYLLDAQKLDLSKAVALMSEICKGVGAAHKEGVVHRDIKPDNLMVWFDEDDKERVKVLDFGLATLRGGADNPVITKGPQIVGTPLYMSPEQCRGNTVDVRSDVYSLAVLMYEMIAGTTPFLVDNKVPICAKHLNDTPARFPDTLNVPPRLESVILHGLAKNPDERPSDATEFLREIRDAVKHIVDKPHGPNRTFELPNRFDFGIVSFRPDELEAIRKVFDLNSKLPSHNLHRNIYSWGVVTADHGQPIYVVHGSPIEYNRETASDLVRDMIENCDPEFILLLGTACGIGAEKKLGQVVYSRLVRSSHNSGYKPDAFVEASNLPPNERLIHLAETVAQENKWWRGVLSRKMKAPIPHYHPPIPRKAEVFSGPDGEDGFDPALFKTIQRLYPQVDSVERGAAIVAHALRPDFLKGKSIGYLMIKGISEIVNTSELDEREQSHGKWALYANLAAAAFARSLIKKWDPSDRQSPLIPAKYLRAFDGPVLRNNTARVIHHLHPERYSQLCELYSDDSTRKIFAVCAFEPSYFISRLSQRHGGSPNELAQLQEKKFLEIADGVFPHFAAFRNLADRRIDVTRIVLAVDSYDAWHSRNKEAINLFVRLNGSVDCYVAEVPLLRNHDLFHLTDHVVFNSALLLDYYDDSQTLIMTYDESGPMHEEFTKFEKHFNKNKTAKGLYRPLNHHAGSA